MRGCAALLLCVAIGYSAPALAVAPEAYISQTVWQVSRAYARHSFGVDPITVQKKPSAQGAELFPVFGMAPKSASGLTWSLTALSADQSVLCITQQVSHVSGWSRAMATMHRAGLAPALESCAEKTSFGPAPMGYPTSISGRQILDRRDVPTATSTPAYPQLIGVDSSAVTRPGLTITASEGAGEFSVFNTYSEVSPGVGALVGVASVETRPEFVVAHNCSVIPPGTGCPVQVSFVGGARTGTVGQLRMGFTNGVTAYISLFGTP